MDEEQQPFTPQDGPSSGKPSQPTTQLYEASQAEKPSDLAEEQSEGAPEWLSGILHELLNTEVKATTQLMHLGKCHRHALSQRWLTLRRCRHFCPELTLADGAGEDRFGDSLAATYQGN